MKAKKIIPENNEQPNPLPTPSTPSNEERKANLAGWQQRIIALAEAHLSVDDEQELIPDILRRALGLCRIVEGMAMGTSPSEISTDALASVMRVLEDHIQIAKWITSGRPLDPHWY